jgi:hypothetical protein
MLNSERPPRSAGRGGCFSFGIKHDAISPLRAIGTAAATPQARPVDLPVRRRVGAIGDVDCGSIDEHLVYRSHCGSNSLDRGGCRGNGGDGLGSCQYPTASPFATTRMRYVSGLRPNRLASGNVVVQYDTGLKTFSMTVRHSPDQGSAAQRRGCDRFRSLLAISRTFQSECDAEQADDHASQN